MPLLKQFISILFVALALAGCQPAAMRQATPTVGAGPTETVYVLLLPPTRTPELKITATPTAKPADCPQTTPEQAAEGVRAALDHPLLSLTHWGNENSIYNHTHRLIILEDPQMTHYKVDCSSGLVVEITRTIGYDATAGKKTAGEMEQQAREIILRAAPGLDLQRLKAAPGTKGDVFWYRWEGAAVLPDPPGGMKAFIQVGLAPDGSIVNYTNLFPLAP
jgi:hypothetical protein